MAKKIYLSPSNQTNNAYAYGDTTEAVQCEKIADATEAALLRCGFAVKNGRGTMTGKVTESNTWGADLHVCIHTNAANGSASGTRIFCSSMDNEGGKAAKAVFAVLAPLTPGTAESVKVRNDLYEITKTNAYCVYIEVDFHDVPSVAQWLMENTTEIGEAIAEGLCNHYGVPYVAEHAEEATEGAAEEADGQKHYYYLRDVPAVYRKELEKLAAKGLLKGRGGAGDDLILDMTEDSVRILAIVARALAES